MVRNSHMPMQNELIVTNCARNLPASRICFEKYRFVRFVEVNGKVYDQAYHKTYVYFILEPILGSNDPYVRLCRLCCDAWPIHPKNTRVSPELDRIEMLDDRIMLD